MQIILIAIGSAGDVFPFIALGNALTLRGHTVTLCSMPVFQATIEQNGLAFVPLCDEATYHAAMGDPKLWDPKTSFTALWKAISGMLEPTYEYIASRRHENIVVVGSLWALGARVAQEKFGIRYLSVQVSPSTLISAHLPPTHPKFNVPQALPLAVRKMLWRSIEYLSLDRVCGPTLNALRAKKGLGGTVKQVFSQWMHSPDGVICLFPEWFAPVQADWPQPLCMAGFPLFDGSHAGLDDELLGFLDAGSPPLVFTHGSTAHFGEHFYAMAQNVLARVGARGIFLAGERPAINGLPASILQRSYVPMTALLPRTAGLVHPGGIGAMSLALAAGVPQIALPVAHDQFDNAERLVRLACGIRLDLPLDEPRLREAVLRLLEDKHMAAACARIRQLSPPAALACEKAVAAIERCHQRARVVGIRAAS